MSRKPITIALLLAAALLGGCTTRDPEALANHDPFEPTNRAVFNVTQKVNRYVVRPVAKGYIAVVPAPARDGIHNALTNLDAPVVMGNEILQGDPKRASRTLGRIVINSTIGVAGLIDVASKIGIPADDTDMGVTFGKWGMPEGPYLFLPGLGPAPPRDALGRIGDTFMDPLFWIKWHNSGTWKLVRSGVSFLDTSAQTVDELEGIERTSVDFYATTRSLYRQHRNAQINGNQPNLQNLPNF